MSKEVSPTEHQLESVMEWARLLEAGKLVNETRNYPNFSQYVMKGILGYDSVPHEEDNIDFIADDNDGNPALVVECKDTNIDLDERQYRSNKEHSTPMNQLWSYMGNSTAAWGMCTNYRFFRLVKKSARINDYHEIDFKTMYDENGADIDKVAEFITIFRNIVLEGDDGVGVGGEAADKEMADAFYDLYRDTRAMIIKEMEARDIRRADAVDAAQTFLNRVIFLFFAESKDLVGSCLFDRQLKQLDYRFPGENTDAFCAGMCKDLFRALDEGYNMGKIPRFNGGLFRDGPGNVSLSFSDYRKQSWFDAVVKPRSYVGRRVKNLMAKHSKISPIICNLVEMHDYDFNTEIDVNVLGHVFEQSIQELDDLRADGMSTQKAEGIYYTPSYVVDFICRHTILPYLSASGGYMSTNELVMEYAAEGNLPMLEKKLRDIKVLDPSSGSGAFLTGAASILLEIYEEIHNTKVLARSFMTKSGIETLDKWSETASMRMIIRDNIYGTDKDAQAAKIAQLSMYLLTANNDEPLPDTSDHILAGNSIISDPSVSDDPIDWKTTFPDVLTGDNPGFDIIIGNPPYGAELGDGEKNYLKKTFDIGGTNTAPIFTHQSLRLLKRGGMHGFIVPKSLMYSSQEWATTRETLIDDLVLLANMGKVWNKVKLEQCIYVVREGSKTTSCTYYVRDDELMRRLGDLGKDTVEIFGALPSIHDETELTLGLKMATMPKLAGLVTNTRGTSMFTKDIGKNGMPLIGGKQVQPFHVNGLKGHVDEALVKEQGYIVEGSVLAQNIVAHKKNPAPHIRIIATVPDGRDFVIADTINQLVPVGGSMSSHFLLGLLSSRVVNWYVYKFLLSEAIRTIHLDRVITNRIPINIKRMGDVERCVKALLKRGGKGDVAALYDELDCVFYDIFGLSEAEICMIKAQTGSGA